MPASGARGLHEARASANFSSFFDVVATLSSSSSSTRSGSARVTGSSPPPASPSMMVAVSARRERESEGGGEKRLEEGERKKRRKSVELIRVRDNTPGRARLCVRYRRNGLRRVTEGVGQGRERPLSTYAGGW